MSALGGRPDVIDSGPELPLLATSGNWASRLYEQEWRTGSVVSPLEVNYPLWFGNNAVGAPMNNCTVKT